jgi:DNA-binding LacI/PurR family transcriptional regulator
MAAVPRSAPPNGMLKRTFIEDRLRHQIVSGKLAPGSRLPTRSELESQFRVSSVTVQLALDRLVEDGFVIAEGRKGTHVAENPPHLSRYALCFPTYPSDGGGWSRFWTALSNEALRLQTAQPRRMTIFHGVDGHADGGDHRRMLADMRAHRLAGVVFAATPFMLVNTPMLEDPGLPRVAIMEKVIYPQVAAVDLDRDSFVRKALDYLASRGRKRIAVLTVPYLDAEYHETFAKELAARQMISHPHWTQLATPSAPVCAKNLVHLLMQGAAGERPDGLVISDDNLVEHATAGLIAAGVSVPGEADVVGHCNFPWPTPSVLPVKRLGYDARQVLQFCLQSIDRQRAGEKPDRSVVPAIFEEEARP